MVVSPKTNSNPSPKFFYHPSGLDYMIIFILTISNCNVQIWGCLHHPSLTKRVKRWLPHSTVASSLIQSKHVYHIAHELVRTPIYFNNYLPHVHLLVTLNRAKTLGRDDISATYLWAGRHELVYHTKVIFYHTTVIMYHTKIILNSNSLYPTFIIAILRVKA